ncbi:hypothetical protein HELRODRAFT_73487, partial [Helobdella robusta]|uniref:Poly [ADP-ribose] polymerase n=1 Tax=Helobdella robusta TaxID=6412 RepID=T1G1E3_HELRO
SKYASVSFTNSLSSCSIIKILQIERVQNPIMFKQYAVGRDAMIKYYKSNPSVQVERRLWHGTGSDTIQAITAEGFNRSYSGKNATCYGNGSYFAKHFSYSANKTYSRPDLNGHKHVFQCLVLTGEFAKGSEGLKAPPMKTNQTKYDSTVDDVSHPHIFVVYNDTYAYPEYIITFV